MRRTIRIKRIIRKVLLFTVLSVGGLAPTTLPDISFYIIFNFAVLKLLHTKFYSS
jgi:hypothetical protein